MVRVCRVFFVSIVCIYMMAVAEHNYADALRMSLTFFDGQFSGPKPEWSKVPWRGSSGTRDGEDVGLDLTGGYHDCGDHVKFGLPMFYSIAMLAWSGVEYPSTYKQVDSWKHLQEIIRWGTDFIVRAHPEKYILYGQVGSGMVDHEVWVMPEFATSNRPSYHINKNSPGSDLAGEASAALSAASIMFREEDSTYSDLLLEHARDLFDFAIEYEGKYSDSITDAAGFYASGGYHDEQLWAALWLFRATREEKYRRYAFDNSRDLVKKTLTWSQVWDDVSNGNMYLMCRLLEDQEACFQVENFMNYWMANGKGTGGNIKKTTGGLSFLTIWGSLRYPTVIGFIGLLYAREIKPELRQVYGEYAVSQVNYVLGDNPIKTSYLVGYGNRYPKKYHHRAGHGSCTNSMTDPENNLHINFEVAGGPDENDMLKDSVSDYVETEGCCDMQVAFISGVVAVVDYAGGVPTQATQNLGNIETIGIEFYVKAQYTIQNDLTWQMTTFIYNRAGWPPRSPKLIFRIFLELNSIEDIIIQSYYNENATITGPFKWKNEKYQYVQVEYGAGFIYPGSTTTSMKQAQITFRLETPTDLSKHWSFQGLKADSPLVINEYIVVYEEISNSDSTYSTLKLAFGKEPEVEEESIKCQQKKYSCNICSKIKFSEKWL
jgi:endoglucanase